MKRLLAMSITCLWLLSACGGPTIDATSRATMISSTEELRNALDEEARDRVDHAIMTILIDSLDPVEVVQYGNRSELMIQREIFSKIKPRFDGLDAEGILAEQVAARESLKKKMGGWEAKRKQLVEKQRLYEASAGALSMVTVTNAQLDVLDSPVNEVLPGQQVQVRMTIRNGSLAVVDGITLQAGVGPVDSNELWAEGASEERFTPSLQPGESGDVVLGPLLLTVPDQAPGRPQAQLAASIDITRLFHNGQSEPLVKTDWSQGDALQAAVFEAAQDVVRQMEVL